MSDCKNDCTFEYEEHAQGLVEAMLAAAGKFSDDNGFEICPVCLREELLSAAASLHMHCLKLNAMQTGNPIPQEHLYEHFCRATHIEMHKLVDIEIENGGMDPLRKQ
jgi:hypothetical protein